MRTGRCVCLGESVSFLSAEAGPGRCREPEDDGGFGSSKHEDGSSQGSRTTRGQFSASHQLHLQMPALVL